MEIFHSTGWEMERDREITRYRERLNEPFPSVEPRVGPSVHPSLLRKQTWRIWVWDTHSTLVGSFATRNNLSFFSFLSLFFSKWKYLHAFSYYKICESPSCSSPLEISIIIMWSCLKQTVFCPEKQMQVSIGKKALVFLQEKKPY